MKNQTAKKTKRVAWGSHTKSLDAIGINALCERLNSEGYLPICRELGMAKPTLYAYLEKNHVRKIYTVLDTENVA